MIDDPLARKAASSELFCVEHGPSGAPPIILIHGITGSHRYWDPIRKGLEKHYRLCAPDLLGFGHSQKPHIRYTIELFRESLRHFIQSKRLADRKPTLIGHSLGGLIAAEYAAEYPAHVEKLVVISLPAYSGESAAHDIFWSGSPSYRNLLTANTISENLSQIKRSGFGMSFLYLSKIPVPVLLDSRKFTFRSLTSTLENCLMKANTEEILSRAGSLPILALHGEKDQVSPLEAIVTLQQKFPNISLKIIRDSGHHILLTHTSECLDAILSFLTDAKRPSGRIDVRKDVHRQQERPFQRTGRPDRFFKLLSLLL